MPRKFEVILYTDGSCKGNGLEHNVGGWGFILDFDGRTRQGSGWVSNTTNNAMELQAIIEGIRALKRPCNVKVVTDSTYVCRNANSIREFRDRNWHTKSGKKMANIDSWMSLIQLCQRGQHHLTFEHIKGHAGHAQNEECDRLATRAAAQGQTAAAAAKAQ